MHFWFTGRQDSPTVPDVAVESVFSIVGLVVAAAWSAGWSTSLAGSAVAGFVGVVDNFVGFETYESAHGGLERALEMVTCEIEGDEIVEATSVAGAAYKDFAIGVIAPAWYFEACEQGTAQLAFDDAVCSGDVNLASVAGSSKGAAQAGHVKEGMHVAHG